MQYFGAARRRQLAAILVIGLAGCASVSLQAAAEEREPVARHAADFSAREITTTLFKAKPGEPIDLSQHNLTYLDLAGLDFKAAKLAHSDFYGTDFTGANLRGVDLSHTRLDRAVLIRADMSGANLSGASILRPTIYTDLGENLIDAPRFAGADLTRHAGHGQDVGRRFPRRRHDGRQSQPAGRAPRTGDDHNAREERA